MSEQTPDDQRDPRSARTRLDRRTAVKTAVGGALAVGVWTRPRVEGMSIVPGYAAFASPGCVPPTLTPFTSDTSGGATWQAGSGDLGPFGFPSPAPAVPTDYNNIGFVPNNRTPIYLVEQDPTPATYAYTTTAATYTSSAFTLTAASTFTFRYNIRWRTTANHTATQRVEVQWARNLAGPWTTPYTLSTVLGSGGFTNVANQSFALAITPANVGVYYLRYRFSFSGLISTATNQRANDLAITLPTVTCV